MARKPALLPLPSLIDLIPLDSWAVVRSQFRELLTHSSLGEVGEWFKMFIDEDIHDSALCECWDSLQSEMRSIAKYAPAGHPAEVFTLRECDDDIYNVVSNLVEYNNNSWNFAPGGAPKKLIFDNTLASVKAVIYPEREAVVKRATRAKA